MNLYSKNIAKVLLIIALVTLFFLSSCNNGGGTVIDTADNIQNTAASANNPDMYQTGTNIQNDAQQAWNDINEASCSTGFFPASCP